MAEGRGPPDGPGGVEADLDFADSSRPYGRGSRSHRRDVAGVSVLIAGKRIGLRCLEADDLNIVAEWRNQPEVRRSFFDKSMIPASGQLKWFDAYLQDSLRQIFIAVDGMSGTPIGMIGLYQINYRDRHAEIGSTVVGDRSRWGQGLGAEMIALLTEYAFQDLNLHRLYAYAVHYNQPSIRAKQKCGFRQEGLLREAHYADGTFHDVVLMAVTRSEWEQQRSTVLPS